MCLWVMLVPAALSGWVSSILWIYFIAAAVMKKSLRSVLRTRIKCCRVIAPLSECDQKYRSTV